MKIFPLLLFTIIILNSCTVFYGIKSPKKISNNEFNQKLNKYGQDTSNSYLINNVSYKQYIKSLKSNIKTINALKQPLQVIYYENGIPVAYFVNCNAGGFPNLKWNKKGDLNVFKPKTQSDISIPLQLDSLKKITLNYKNQSLKKTYTIVFLWSDFMKKQTQSFFIEFNKNLSLVSKNDIEVIYINIDNLYIQ